MYTLSYTHTSLIRYNCYYYQLYYRKYYRYYNLFPVFIIFFLFLNFKYKENIQRRVHELDPWNCKKYNFMLVFTHIRRPHARVWRSLMYCFIATIYFFLFNNILPFSLSFMFVYNVYEIWMDRCTKALNWFSFVGKQCHVVQLFYNKCVITACLIYWNKMSACVHKMIWIIKEAG